MNSKNNVQIHNMYTSNLSVKKIEKLFTTIHFSLFSSSWQLLVIIALIKLMKIKPWDIKQSTLKHNNLDQYFWQFVYICSLSPRRNHYDNVGQFIKSCESSSRIHFKETSSTIVADRLEWNCAGLINFGYYTRRSLFFFNWEYFTVKGNHWTV
jgi:hypothetical protein